MAHYSTIHDQGSDLPPCKPATSIGYAERLPPASPDVERTEVADAYETTAEDNTMKEYSKFTEWRLEMLSWALGTAIIGGIVAILAKFNDTPAAEWSASIQISTVVAFLAQIAQAALLFPTQACIGQLKWMWFGTDRKAAHLQKFDEASRGPLGSLTLLLTLSFTPRLVHLGALITIFMLVFSTFFQQAIQTRLKPLQNMSQGNVNRLRDYSIHASPDSYSVDYVYQNDLARATNYLSNTITMSMLADSQDLSDVKAFCPSAQCNWDPYTTLAICYFVEDVSSQLVEQPYSIEGSKQITLPGLTISNTNDYLTTWFTTIFSVNGIARAIGPPQSDFNASELQRMSPESNFDVAHVYLAYQDPCLMKNMSDTSKQSWRAFKATTKICLQTLNTTYNGSTETTVIKSYTNPEWTTTNSSQSRSSRPNGNWTTNLGNNLETFSVDFKTAELIGNQLATLFNSSVSIIPGRENHFYGSMFPSRIVSNVLGPNMSVCANGTVYGLPAFDKRIANVAIGLTNALRASDSSTAVYGRSFQTVQFIHVDFSLLALPAALFVAITIFFLATVIRTTSAPVWKSSQLAVLYALHEPEKLGTKSHMEKESKKVKLRFRGKGSWQMEHD